jgi:hypothetical protein
MKPNYNRQHIMLKLGLLSAGALLCLIPLVSLPSIAEAAARPQTTLQLAAGNDCLNDISEGFSVETTNYLIGICYKNNEWFYVSHAKKGNARTFLPAFYNKAENTYVAQNSKYAYTLDLRNNQLTINLPNGRISTEKVIVSG